MQRVGMFLMAIALFSVVWNLLGRELKILMWIDNWGTTVGWVIRGGLFLVGGGLWLGGRTEE